MKTERTKKLILTALFLSLGIVLPFFTGQVPQIGSMLLPMHIPVFLCSMICGWQFGTPLAFILPLFRSVAFGRPNMYPEAIAIAFEMSTYALVSGVIYANAAKSLKGVYLAMGVAMPVGRVVRGAVQLLLLGLSGRAFTFKAFFVGIVLYSLPGIILQLIAVPAVMSAFFRHGYAAKNKGLLLK